MIWGDSLDIVSSWVCKQSRNIWLLAWSEQWLSAHRKADSAMVEFVCRPGWRLYKNLFILVGETALAVTGVWNRGYSLSLVIFIIHGPKLNGSGQEPRKRHFDWNFQVCHIYICIYINILTIICPNGPIFMIFWNCSYMSLRLNTPGEKTHFSKRMPIYHT